MALSGGVAPGYYLVPLQGTTNLPFGLTPHFSPGVWKGGVEPRRYKTFLIIPVSRVPRSPSA
ncbi:MAG: hypothetical protein WCD04_03100, partial [Terriglobia bacterium]